MALTGRVVGAEEALRVGLVNEVIPHEEVSEEETSQDLEAYAQPCFMLKPEHRRDLDRFLGKDG